MAARRVLSVGQCWADHGSISEVFQRHWNVGVEPAEGADDALSLLRQGSFDLVLVNRVFDADGSSGVTFIQTLKADEALRNVPVMLVSNYDDAQREAVDAGAVPGFGKGALGHPAMLERVKAVLEKSGVTRSPAGSTPGAAPQ